VGRAPRRRDTEPDAVIHKSTGRRLPYSALVDKAAKLPVPQNPKLKTPDQFRYIGKAMPRATRRSRSMAAIFGMDVQVPGMLIASIERCPVFGGKVKTFDATRPSASAASRTWSRFPTASRWWVIRSGR